MPAGPFRDNWLTEEEEWARLSPAERFAESQKLWATYLILGGSLDPERDPDSPFDFPEMEFAVPLDGRSGVRLVRRGGV